MDREQLINQYVNKVAPYVFNIGCVSNIIENLINDISSRIKKRETQYNISYDKSTNSVLIYDGSSICFKTEKDNSELLIVYLTNNKGCIAGRTVKYDGNCFIAKLNNNYVSEALKLNELLKKETVYRNLKECLEIEVLKLLNN